jgi:hypothetical protein
MHMSDGGRGWREDLAKLGVLWLGQVLMPLLHGGCDCVCGIPAESFRFLFEDRFVLANVALLAVKLAES